MIGPAATPRQLSTAEDRREALILAAMGVFAAKGFYGTPTLEIARAAGISQAYLFRLFPTKTELFLAVSERCIDRTYAAFAEAAATAKAAGEDVLDAMGAAYSALLSDRRLLLGMLHAHAAASEPEVRACLRKNWKRLVELVERESGATPGEVQHFFALGMLFNDLAAMGADEVDEHWANVLMLGDDC